MTGLLLVNLGTPDRPEPGPVRRYLREFLSDPYVIDIAPVARWLLLNLIILPLRPRKSAAAYRAIWHPERGSPLLFHSRDLEAAVRARLDDDWTVALAMRYGAPSIRDGLIALRDAGVDRIVAFPLYPQYALSSTETSRAAIERTAAEVWDEPPPLAFVAPFYDAPEFVDAFAAVARPALDEARPDHVLFSFHGLPERHVRKTDPTGLHCLHADDCCARIGDANRNCYRAQSFATARALAARLDLPAEDWTVSFQSRLGRTPWIRPFTDEVVVSLAERGIKRLAVVCPSFVADCLETLEEIGLRAAEAFRAAGGERLTLVPSLNSAPEWADAVCALARRAAAAAPLAPGARP
ncbi:MAG: ferrochelatase [Deltaproteobacteria bacterium]|nr:MAG: ferrochelatase [Deltaproteobacteria bacterium]